FACAFGEQEYGKKYYEIAEKMKKALITYFYNKDEGRFARMGKRAAKGYELDMTVDASLYGLVAFGTFSPKLSMLHRQ
ncbi:MAG: glycoside hydrolase family 15 protein, partial [Candidatus Brocadiales bacterium]|nr:glycoside hydrolase family 15 protein [Candidatus Brocadiales bacterium]